MTDRELRSRRLLIGAIGMSLVMIAAWSWLTMSDARAGAIAANDDLAECKALVESIRKINDRPPVIALEASSQAGISAEVEETVQAVGLPANSLRIVDPQEPERIGETQYENRSTRIEIEEATLRQILQFSEQMEAKNAGYRMRDLVLTVNENSSRSRELWDVEAVLTQTVFSPTTQ